MTLRTKPSLIPKTNRKAVYEYLFTQGVLVVQKDSKLPKHPDIEVPNLHVMMIMKSLNTQSYVEEKFNWQHHYYILTNTGVEHLREYLNLPSYVFPATFTKYARTGGGGGRGEKGNTNSNWRPRGGFGRGRDVPAVE
ncbi:ribosomal protein RPS10 [Cardiosporidium cionae]|uniref:Ribosomal protein RPS10 n=1 Tax=Cardiosporidium cionae TaxID=476202 RepID=A0ABQ7JF63_9APIC|nr:ribosomal protein RPS10 [Cardiosporidium cionae]|eukprot:KAF8822650.1 ribosomal protein RPS10 [Cardiosporidium cionae]